MSTQQTDVKSRSRKRGRRVWLWRFAALGVLFVAAMVWRWSERRATGMILQVTCSYAGGSDKSDQSWDLVLDGGGDGLLTTVGTFPGRRIVAPETLVELQSAIAECDLRNMPSDSGAAKPDQAKCKITIRTTYFERTLTIQDPKKADGDVCAVRLWQIIQRCHDAQTAVGDKRAK
jgi:hypothetical protein